jgi:hypothetical protein
LPNLTVPNLTTPYRAINEILTLPYQTTRNHALPDPSKPHLTINEILATPNQTMPRLTKPSLTEYENKLKNQV